MAMDEIYNLRGVNKIYMKIGPQNIPDPAR